MTYTGPTINWSIETSNHQSIDPSINISINQSIHWFIHRLRLWRNQGATSTWIEVYHCLWSQTINYREFSWLNFWWHTGRQLWWKYDGFPVGVSDGATLGLSGSSILGVDDSSKVNITFLALMKAVKNAVHLAHVNDILKKSRGGL